MFSNVEKKTKHEHHYIEGGPTRKTGFYWRSESEPSVTPDVKLRPQVHLTLPDMYCEEKQRSKEGHKKWGVV